MSYSPIDDIKRSLKVIAEQIHIRDNLLRSIHAINAAATETCQDICSRPEYFGFPEHAKNELDEVIANIMSLNNMIIHFISIQGFQDEHGRVKRDLVLKYIEDEATDDKTNTKNNVVMFFHAMVETNLKGFKPYVE